MFPRKLLIVSLFCSAPAGAEMSPVSTPEKGSDEIRAAAQFLSLYSNVLDCENVGYIQTGEADEHFAPIFLSSDIDKSRSLSQKELMNNPAAKNRSLLGVAFSKMDQDANGSATPDELRIYLNKAVSTVDGDADGDVFPVEYEHAIKTGTVLKTAVPDAIRKTNKQSDTVPPWVRHLKALYQKKVDSTLQTAESSASAAPETDRQ